MGNAGLEKIKAWFDSGEAYALIRIYAKYGDTCCYCTEPRLPTENFESNMIKMQLAVGDVLDGQTFPEHERINMKILFGMLGQMYGSVGIAEDAVDASSGRNVRKTLENARALASSLSEDMQRLLPRDSSDKRGGGGGGRVGKY